MRNKFNWYRIWLWLIAIGLMLVLSVGTRLILYAAFGITPLWVTIINGFFWGIVLGISLILIDNKYGW